MQNVPPHLQWVEAMRPEEAAFLRDLPFTISVPSHRLLIVHAGLVPRRPKHRQHLQDMYKVPALFYNEYLGMSLQVLMMTCCCSRLGLIAACCSSHVSNRCFVAQAFCTIPIPVLISVKRCPRVLQCSYVSSLNSIQASTFGMSLARRQSRRFDC